MARLLFGSIVVGNIAQPLFCDETWHGILTIDAAFEAHAAAKRFLAYKRFSETWNARLRKNQQKPPDAAEFDKFRDLTESENWTIEDDESVAHHVNAPLFLRGGEFTCRPWNFVHPDR